MSKLTLEKATLIAQKAIERGREKRFAKLAVVVLDESGNVKVALRDDGASMFRVDVATGKAWGAVAMGCSSRALGNRAKGNPNFFLGLAATSGGKLLAQPGAVAIRGADGELLGACGASGATGDEDEECCAWGVEQAGFKADAAG